MADAALISIADAVVELLNGGTYETGGWTAVRKNLPKWGRPELTTLRVTVVGAEVETEILNRSAEREDYRVQIGIQKVLDDGDDNSESDPLVRLGEQLRQRLQAEPVLTSTPAARYTGSRFLAPYDAGKLQSNEFLAVLEGRYRVMR